jgi:hypothetical protein
MTYEELTAAIGDVTLRFGQIESMMSLLIAFQYSDRENYQTFIADVLADDGFSFGLRCSAVRKVLVRNGLTEKEANAAIQPLRDLGGTRNMLAHVGKIGFAGQGGGFLHPKKVGEVLSADDLKELRERFETQHAAAFSLLNEWVEKTSPYLREFRRLEAEALAQANGGASGPSDPTPPARTPPVSRGRHVSPSEVKRNVVILGTGSTIGTLGRITSARELGVNGFTTRLLGVVQDWRDRFPHLAAAIDESGSENLDQIWTHFDYKGKLRRSLKVELPDDDPTSGELHQALVAAYSLTKEVDEVNRDSTFSLKTTLMGMGAGDVLISFNWDTVAERLATRLGRTLLVAGPDLDTDAVNLVKPHGSLSWKDGGTAETTTWQGDHRRPLLDPIPLECVHPGPGKVIQPLLLGAVPMKERLLKGTQENQKVYEAFADQWAAVVDAIAGATSLTVMGYRFPSEDAYGRFLLREAVRRRTAPMPPIDYYALETDRAELERALREVFGQEVRCSFLGPVEPAAPKRLA